MKPYTQNYLSISEYKDRQIIEKSDAQIGDDVWLNLYGESYYGTSTDWMEISPFSAGVSDNENAEWSDEEFENYFNDQSESFTKFVLAVDDKL
jgi:hypothetical protein